MLAANCVLEGQATSLEVIIQVEQNVQERSARDILKDIVVEIENEEKTSVSQGQLDFDFITRLYTFPYVAGSRFVLKRYVEEEKSFTAMFGQVPISTEQVLHIDKFVKGETPQITHLERHGSIIAKDRFMFGTTLGEQFIKEMLVTLLRNEGIRCKKAAAGWGGDYVLVMNSGEKPFFLWDTVWDSQADAKEFYSGYVAFTKARYKGRSPRKSQHFNALFSNSETITRIRWTGKRVIIVEGIIPKQILVNVVKSLQI
jgi:hypothetical protein